MIVATVANVNPNENIAVTQKDPEGAYRRHAARILLNWESMRGSVPDRLQLSHLVQAEFRNFPELECLIREHFSQNPACYLLDDLIAQLELRQRREVPAPAAWRAPQSSNAAPV